MRCAHCKKNYEEKEIQLSHDIPCYLFREAPIRRQRKQLADKYSRHWLCKKCHEDYEKELKNFLITTAQKFAERWFQDG